MPVTEQYPDLQQLATLISSTCSANDLDNSSTEDDRALAELQKRHNNAILPLLNFHGITLLANENGVIKSNALPQIKLLKSNAIAAELLKAQALQELGKALMTAGLSPALLFKGTPLAYSTYPAPWLRPRSDTDILFKVDDKPTFEKVLTDNGYRKQFGISGEHVNHQSTWVKTIANGFSLHLDCHTRISNRAILANAFDHNDLVQHSTPIPGLSEAWVQPSVVDSLLIAIMHRIGHHANEERLIWLYDIHLLLSSFSDDDWQQLLLSCQKKRLCGLTHEAITLSQSLFNSPADSTVLHNLSLTTAVEEPSQFFLNREYPEWRHLLHDLQGLASFKQKCQYLIQNIFPDREYMRRQMSTNSLTFAYLKRIISGIKKRF